MGRGKYCSRKCYELGKRKQTKSGKICSRCEQEKALSDFPLRSRDGLCGAICRDCRSRLSQKHIRKIKTRWANSKKSAIKRKGEHWWTITESDYSSLVSEQCHYCGGDLNPSGVGLDRKQNDFGYTIKNVVPCCKQCNIIKNKFLTYEEMMLLSPILKQIRESRT